MHLHVSLPLFPAPAQSPETYLQTPAAPSTTSSRKPFLTAHTVQSQKFSSASWPLTEAPWMTTSPACGSEENESFPHHPHHHTSSQTQIPHRGSSKMKDEENRAGR